MNITLYQAAEDLSEILDQLDPDTGELPEGYETARTLVQNKALAVSAHILNTEAHLNILGARIKELQDAAKRGTKRIEWLRRYLAENMAATGITKIDGPDFSAKLERERDASVDVFQPELLPPDYLREIPARLEPDKALIKRAIADGHEVPGARIVKKDRLTLK